MPKRVVGKIYKTKHGQPFKVLPSGKCRFIKKSAVGGKKKKSAPKAALGGSARVGGALRRPWQKL